MFLNYEEQNFWKYVNDEDEMIEIKKILVKRLKILKYVYDHYSSYNGYVSDISTDDED